MTAHYTPTKQQHRTQVLDAIEGYEQRRRGVRAALPGVLMTLIE